MDKWERLRDVIKEFQQKSTDNPNIEYFTTFLLGVMEKFDEQSE